MNPDPQSAVRSERVRGDKRIVIGGLLGAVLLLTEMVSTALAQREEARPPRLKF